MQSAPVDDDVLNLEAKHTSNAPVNNSRRMLVRKKRAFELARLLDARRILNCQPRTPVTDPAIAIATMEREEIRSAINTAMSAIKSQRIGTNLLEITTCGAVAPYNRMLGGKLVALLLLSPQVAADNKQPLRRTNRLLSALNSRTHGSSPITLWSGSARPASFHMAAASMSACACRLTPSPLGSKRSATAISAIRPAMARYSSGTPPFARIETVMCRRRGYRDVNSVFGEGASPKLRKLRSGLDELGFNASQTMLHHQGRRIYGVPLFPERRHLFVRSQPECSRLHPFTRILRGRQRAHRRVLAPAAGLARRLEHEESWTTLGETGPWLLSSIIPDPPSADAVPGGGQQYRRLTITVTM